MNKSGKLKNRICFLLLGILMTMLLSGCARGETEPQNPVVTTKEKEVVLREFSFLDTATGAWKDNSLDAESGTGAKPRCGKMS